MKINAVLKKPDFLIKQSSNKKISIHLIVTVVSIVFGIVSGCVLFSLNADLITESLIGYFIDFSTKVPGKSYMEILCGFIFASIPYFAVMFMLGLSVIGMIPAYALTYFKMSGLGILTAYIFGRYALKGFEYFLMIILPGKAVLILAIMILTQECASASLKVKRIIAQKNTEQFYIKQYLRKCAFVFMLFILSALLDSLTLKIFSPLFNF